MSKVVVQLVTWNGAKYIPFLFDSLKKQASRDWELVVLDNNSTDETAALIENELKQFPVPARLIKNSENLGFAKGHNMIFKMTQSPYCLLLNQDMYLASNCIEKLALFLELHDAVSAVSPRLMRWRFDLLSDGLEKSLSEDIDALGMQIFRNRRVVEQYTKQNWSVVKSDLENRGLLRDGTLEVFGVSGAFPMYRRSAVEAVVYADGGLFDESYVAYKEDVDLAYRLQESGTKAYVLTDVVAHHDRTGAGAEELSDKAAVMNKKSQSKYVSYHSYKNHLRTLIKHEYWQNILLDFPWILWYELKKFGYYLVFDRSILKGLGEVWQTRKDLCSKRATVVKNKKVAWGEMRRWW